MNEGAGALLGSMTEILRSIDIPHMVVGSFASTFHGVPRTTHDLDLVIDPSVEQLDRLVAGLDPERYYVDLEVARDALARRTMFNVIEIETAWKVDLVIKKARPFSVEELSRREPAILIGVAVPMATAEDTIISKLEWAKDGASSRQLEDVAGILRLRGGQLDLNYIARWVGELGIEKQWSDAEALATSSRSG
ncbi:MAG: hypothetical protein H0V17_20245 [Deltaproteobacteria bacterium]|nr:hypothetical protein [Deltaproteobacteria bacterium]